MVGSHKTGVNNGTDKKIGKKNKTTLQKAKNRENKEECYTCIFMFWIV